MASGGHVAPRRIYPVFAKLTGREYVAVGTARIDWTEDSPAGVTRSGKRESNLKPEPVAPFSCCHFPLGGGRGDKVVRNETRQPGCNPTALRGGPRGPSDFTALCYAAAGEGASFGRLLALRANRWPSLAFRSVSPGTVAGDFITE